MSTDTDRIRMLNDEPGKHLLGGGAVITAGIAELGQDALERLVKFQIAGSLSALFLHFRGAAKWAANPKRKNRNLMNYFFCVWMLREGHVALGSQSNIASAAVDIKCRVLISQPRSVSAWGRKLPGLHRGKLVMPRIRRDLYDTILEVAPIAAEQDKAEMEAGAAEQSSAPCRL